jgi:hypothetical protein
MNRVIINVIIRFRIKRQDSVNKILFVLLAVLSTFSEAGLLTYRYDLTIDYAFGSLDAETVLTGEFSFDSEQPGTDIDGLSNAKRFEISGLSLSGGGESINLNIVSGLSDGWLVVGDDSPATPAIDFFNVRAEGNPAFTGTLGGLAVDDLYLIWVDHDGSANDNFALPSNEDIFNAYQDAIFEIYGSGSAFTSGEISNVSLVPLPTAVWLFGSGLLGLVGMARRKKAA